MTSPGTVPVEPRRRWLGALLLTPLIVAGLAGAYVAGHGYSSESAFVFSQQQTAGRVQPAAVERVVSRSNDPTPNAGSTAAASATCRAGATSTFGNPWVCTVRYQAHDAVTYRITVDNDGSLHGADRTGTLTIKGCCAVRSEGR